MAKAGPGGGGRGKPEGGRRKGARPLAGTPVPALRGTGLTSQARRMRVGDLRKLRAGLSSEAEFGAVAAAGRRDSPGEDRPERDWASGAPLFARRYLGRGASGCYWAPFARITTRRAPARGRLTH